MMTAADLVPELDVAVPGTLDQKTGGYLYDAHMVEGLRARGWTVRVHELPGRFPDPDETARDAVLELVGGRSASPPLLVDGLVLPALAASGRPGRSTSASPGDRLRIALVHHPVSDESGLPPRTRSRLQVLEHTALEACSGAIVTSRFTASRLHEAFGVGPERVRVVPPGTGRPPDTQAPDRSAIRPPRLLCVGSVVPRKGQDVLMRALSSLEGLEWRCVLAGSLDRDRDYVKRVRELIGAARLEERVSVVGEVSHRDLSRLYRESSVFVLPSFYEGYGMALTEAMSHGLPIVSTTGGAIPETVPAQAARLVAPGDAAALSHVLGELLREPDTRERLGAAARTHARTLPTWDDATERFAAALVSLVL